MSRREGSAPASVCALKQRAALRCCPRRRSPGDAKARRCTRVAHGWGGAGRPGTRSGGRRASCRCNLGSCARCQSSRSRPRTASPEGTRQQQPAPPQRCSATRRLGVQRSSRSQPMGVVLCGPRGAHHEPVSVAVHASQACRVVHAPPQLAGATCGGDDGAQERRRLKMARAWRVRERESSWRVAQAPPPPAARTAPVFALPARASKRRHGEAQRRQASIPATAAACVAGAGSAAAPRASLTFVGAGAERPGQRLGDLGDEAALPRVGAADLEAVHVGQGRRRPGDAQQPAGRPTWSEVSVAACPSRDGGGWVRGRTSPLSR